MAVGKVNVISENSGFKRYIGVAPFTVEGVNLNKEQLSALYGREVTNEPVYNSTVDLGGKQVPRAAIVFYLSTEINGEKEFFSARYSLTRAPQIGTVTGKYHVIDKYGRTAWVTEAELSAHQLPENQRVSADYRPMYGSNEEYLIRFFRALLGVPQVEKWKKENGVNTYVGLIDSPEDAVLTFDDIEKFFAGDFSELRAMVAMTTNKVKFAVGIRRGDDNRTYHDLFINFPMPANSGNYARLEREIRDAQDNGAYANTTFEICDLKEWVETPTDFSDTQPAVAAAPAANPWFK